MGEETKLSVWAFKPLSMNSSPQVFTECSPVPRLWEHRGAGDVARGNGCHRRVHSHDTVQDASVAERCCFVYEKYLVLVLKEFTDEWGGQKNMSLQYNAVDARTRAGRAPCGSQRKGTWLCPGVRGRRPGGGDVGGVTGHRNWKGKVTKIRNSACVGSSKEFNVHDTQHLLNVYDVILARAIYNMTLEYSTNNVML